MTEQPTPTPKPIATFGDWVRTADGTPATVIHAQPCRSQTTNRTGISYTLMLKGGHERDYTHYDGDDHLTRPTRFGPDRTEKTEPLFTVIDPENV